ALTIPTGAGRGAGRVTCPAGTIAAGTGVGVAMRAERTSLSPCCPAVLPPRSTELSHNRVGRAQIFCVCVQITAVSRLSCPPTEGEDVSGPDNVRRRGRRDGVTGARPAG